MPMGFHRPPPTVANVGRDRGEPITITERGRVVARLVPADDENDRSWQRVRGTIRWVGGPLAPVVEESEIDALR